MLRQNPSVQIIMVSFTELILFVQFVIKDFFLFFKYNTNSKISLYLLMFVEQQKKSALKICPRTWCTKNFFGYQIVHHLDTV